MKTEQLSAASGGSQDQEAATEDRVGKRQQGNGKHACVLLDHLDGQCAVACGFCIECRGEYSRRRLVCAVRGISVLGSS
jgi:hypothetical protein